MGKRPFFAVLLVLQALAFSPLLFASQNAQTFELVCQSRLNMRTAPNVSSTRMGQIPCRTQAGTREKVSVLETDSQTGWMRVLYNNEVAWVSGDYLRPLPEQSAAVASERFQTQPGELVDCVHLNYRAGPSTSHVIRGTFSCRTNRQNTPVQVIGKDPDSGWYIVERGGERGYVSPRHLSTRDDQVRAVASITEALQCAGRGPLCESSPPTPLSGDCTNCETQHSGRFLPNCEVLSTSPQRTQDFDQLNRCYEAIQAELLRGLNRNNPNRHEAFRRMYSRLHPREQHFLAMTMTSIGEAGILPPPVDEMVIVMKVIENRTREANRRHRNSVSELDVVLQPWQFSMYNAGESLWHRALRTPANNRQRRYAIEAYIRYQHVSYDNPREADRIYHYHTNYVSPNWRSTSRIVRPSIGGQQLRQSGTRHIFYRDIAWGFRHNQWSGKR
jgi:uncharacterized protein YgiM (DUF1202 family)/spore germination cell wall hydrolase CwlJ-like protein